MMKGLSPWRPSGDWETDFRLMERLVNEGVPVRANIRKHALLASVAGGVAPEHVADLVELCGRSRADVAGWTARMAFRKHRLDVLRALWHEAPALLSNKVRSSIAESVTIGRPVSWLAALLGGLRRCEGRLLEAAVRASREDAAALLLANGWPATSGVVALAARRASDAVVRQVAATKTAEVAARSLHEAARKGDEGAWCGIVRLAPWLDPVWLQRALREAPEGMRGQVVERIRDHWERQVRRPGLVFGRTRL